MTPIYAHFAVAIVTLPALVLIARRAGLSPWWAGLVLLPVLGWPLVATVYALRRWPSRPTDAWKAPRGKKKGRAHAAVG
jgi:hypothetical protein